MLGSVSAADHATPGTPGDPNCHGQSAAFLAQLAKNSGADVKPGLGNLAKVFGVSVKDLQAQIDAFCATP